MKHSGVVFPMFVYQNIPFFYSDKRVDVGKLGEVYLIIFMKNLDKHTDDVFVKNFLTTFSKIINRKIKYLNLCDFSAFKDRKLIRKPVVADNTVLVNDKYHTYNPHVEPASIFIGRGNHPKRGVIKRPLTKSDVILNMQCSESDKLEWGGVVNDNEAHWVAKYKDVLTGEQKYIVINGMKDDREKYDIARKLYHKIIGLRKENAIKLESMNEITRQCATCLHLIDMLCIRVGVEKDPKETAETVGCCSLRVKHVTLSTLNAKTITFKFLGKDSVEWNKSLVNPIIYSNLKRFMNKKKPESRIFSVQPSQINTYIQGFIHDVTAKSFRTTRASEIMLKHLKKGVTLECFKNGNKDVARALCHVKGRNADLSLSTSKTNYIDPRIVVAWTKKHGIPIDQIYGPSMREKHDWASSIGANFIY